MQLNKDWIRNSISLHVDHRTLQMLGIFAQNRLDSCVKVLMTSAAWLLVARGMGGLSLHWPNLPTRLTTSSMSVSYSSSGSTASVGNDIEGSAIATKTISSNSADSCTWYANASCKRPRTCYDCLNVQVASGECAIMPNGMCVDLTEYSQFLNNQQDFGIYYKYYPSSNYTYCSADDSVCSACSSNWVSTYTTTGTIDTPTYCTGLDGCICLDRCELPDWSTSILTDECDSSGSSGVNNSRTSTASRIGFALAVGLVFGVLLGLWGIKLLFRRHVGRGRASSIPAGRETWTVPRRPRTGPQLALTGWKELREKLIAIEQEAFGGTEVATQARNENSTATDVPDASMEEGSAYHSVSSNSQAHCRV